jgi:hypothetical protein
MGLWSRFSGLRTGNIGGICEHGDEISVAAEHKEHAVKLLPKIYSVIQYFRILNNKDKRS